MPGRRREYTPPTHFFRLAVPCLAQRAPHPPACRCRPCLVSNPPRASSLHARRNPLAERLHRGRRGVGRPGGSFARPCAPDQADRRAAAVRDRMACGAGLRSACPAGARLRLQRRDGRGGAGAAAGGFRGAARSARARPAGAAARRVDGATPGSSPHHPPAVRVRTGAAAARAGRAADLPEGSPADLMFPRTQPGADFFANIGKDNDHNSGRRR